MNSAEVFSNNVKNIMKKKGMKLKELAEGIGLSASYLSLVLNNCRGNLSDVYRDRIATVLNTSVADLYTEVEEERDDVVQIIDTQIPITDKERILQLGVLEDAIKLLENGYPDVQTAFYYGFGSLTEEEAVTVTRFFRRVIDKYLSLREAFASPRDGNDNISTNRNENCKEKQREFLKKIHSEFHEGSQTVLAFVAIIGDGCSLELLEELTHISREIIKFHLHELAQASLIEIEEVMEDSIIRFRDNVVEKSAYRLMNPARRAEIHRQVARILEARSDASYKTLYKIVTHYQKAGCIDKSLEYSLKAAECACNLQQYRHSLKHYADAAVLLKYNNQDEDLAKIYQQMAIIHKSLFNEKEAFHYFNISSELYRKCKNEKGTAIVLCEIGSIWFLRGEIKKAIADLEKSLTVFRKLKEKDESYGQILIRLGSAYGRQGQLEQALSYYQEARCFITKKGYRDLLGQVLTGLGLIAMRQRRWEEAVDYFIEALREVENDGTQRTRALAFGNLGLAYLEKGNLEEAIATLKKSIEFYTQAGDARYGAYASVTIAKAYLQKGDLRESLRYAEETLPILQQAKDEAEMAEAFRVIGHIARVRKEWRIAVRFLEESVKLLQDCKWKNDNQKITEQLAQAYYDLGSTLKEKGDMVGEVYCRKAYDFYAQYQLNIKYLQDNYRRFTPAFIVGN